MTRQGNPGDRVAETTAFAGTPGADRAESLLRATLDQTIFDDGGDVLTRAVAFLAETLRCDSVFIAEAPVGDPGRTHLIAHWCNGKPGSLTESDVFGALCALIGSDDIFVIADELQRDLPEDAWLGSMSARSFVGLELADGKTAPPCSLGLIGSAPILLTPAEILSLRIFATKVKHEIEKEGAAAALRSTIGFRNRLVQSSPAGVNYRNFVTGETWSNPQFIEIVGRSYEACRTLGWEHVIHPDDLDAFRAGSERLVSEGVTMSQALRVIRPDGRVGWIKLHAAAGLDEDGKPQETTAFLIDQTDEREIQAQLEATAAQLDRRNTELESSLNAVPDIRVRLTAEGSYLSVWAADRDRLLARPEDLVGSRVDDHFPAALAGRIHEAIEQTISTRAVTSIEYSIGEHDNVIHYEARLAPCGEDEVLAVVRDISDRKALEDRLVHAETMQSVGRLAGGIAHDFNNVLQVISGHAAALRADLADPAAADRRLDAINAAVDRTSTLINRLMFMSRPAPNNPGPLAIDTFVLSLIPAIGQLVGDAVLVERELGTDQAAVIIDESRFENVLLNLATNARDAMPGGGTLLIRTSTAPNGTVRIDVIDSGQGMESDAIGKIFEPFFTTKAPGTGTGLGLATSYATIVEAGGTITANSSPGAGTTVTIWLPSTFEWPPEPEPPQRDGARDRAGPATILIVEDEVELLELCSELLRSRGYETIEARGGEDALDVIRRGVGVDLVLTDVAMGKMSGPVLAEEVSKSAPGVPVVFMSGYAGDLLGGAIESEPILRKPFSPAELCEAIERRLLQSAQSS